MKIYFFTAADDHYKRETEILFRSANKFGREVDFYPIPAGKQWQRYKVELLESDLPKADKYVYLDSDTVFTCRGDWESPECEGVMDILYYMSPTQRIKPTQGFIRNHTLLVGETAGYEYVLDLWRRFDCPAWNNSGVTVLTAQNRIPFVRSWRRWMEQIDRHCEKGIMIGDEAPLCFAKFFYGLPSLPPRFNGCCKWQEITDDHVLIHADGNVAGEKRLPYVRAVQNLYDERNPPIPA